MIRSVSDVCFPESCTQPKTRKSNKPVDIFCNNLLQQADMPRKKNVCFLIFQTVFINKRSQAIDKSVASFKGLVTS